MQAVEARIGEHLRRIDLVEERLHRSVQERLEAVARLEARAQAAERRLAAAVERFEEISERVQGSERAQGSASEESGYLMVVGDRG